MNPVQSIKENAFQSYKKKNSIVLFVNKKHVSTVILTNITFVSALHFVHEHPCYAIRFYTTNLLFRILLMTDHIRGSCLIL